jgi:two-component system, LytTR family, sensor kinase
LRLKDTLELRVQDDGPGFSSEGSVGSHPSANQRIGLANTRARLKQLSGEQARLTTGNGKPSGAAVTITLSYHTVPGTFETEVMELHALHDADR